MLLFIVPAILDGQPPLAVALVGSMAVMLVTISLAHGLGPKSLAAILGTTFSLILVGVLAVIFTNLTNLTGFSSEEATLIAVGNSDISISGLLIAGIIIGALGVLDDVTISQSSTVMALRAADPGQSFRGLYSRAIEVGRDHVSATVNTLVLAYVGSSLPVLIIFGSGQLGAGRRGEPGDRRQGGRGDPGRFDRPDRRGSDHHCAGRAAGRYAQRRGAARRPPKAVTTTKA